MTDVERFYDDNADREAVRPDRRRTEFAVTMRAITAHMASPAAVLDIGGEPGRYALSLASQGYAVSLAELSQRSLDLARQRAREMSISLAVERCWILWRSGLTGEGETNGCRAEARARVDGRRPAGDAG